MHVSKSYFNSELESSGDKVILVLPHKEKNRWFYRVIKSEKIYFHLADEPF